jgi:hypothetical protein
MSELEKQDVAEILQGYENWRQAKIGTELSVSEFLDDLARQRAYDAVQEIRTVYSDPELTWQEVDAQVRRILGVEQ